MPKKIRIQVAGNPQYTSPHQKRAASHPRLVVHTFGTFPGFTLRGVAFPAATIILRRGKHEGAHRGFGLEHILAEHPELVPTTTAAAATATTGGHDAVVQFVGSILQAGAGIYYEGGVGAQGRRSSVVRNAIGTAILEFTQDKDGNPFYSVVTAYRGAHTRGTLVGRL